MLGDGAGAFRPIITDAKSKRLVMEFKQRNEEFDAARVSEVEARRSASRAARKLADVAPEKIDEMEAELIARGVLLEVECSDRVAELVRQRRAMELMSAGAAATDDAR